MDLFAVFGQPIEHSLSPLLHNGAFQNRGLPAFYLPVSCTPHELAEKLQAFRTLGGVGANLTRPLKELIVPSLLKSSPWVASTGAANVLLWQDGGWCGENTDVQALIDCLPSSKGRFGQRALVLGSGGAARATAVALNTLKYQVTVMARRPEGVTWCRSAIAWDWDVLLSPPYDVVVNATPIGQNGEVSWPVTPVFSPDTIVADWVYRPNVTTVMKAAELAGAVCVDGLSLLVKQAALSWVPWFGMAGPEMEMRAYVKDYYAD